MLELTADVSHIDLAAYLFDQWRICHIWGIEPPFERRH